ncbi:MAG TPA: preprotein translocase subunit SecA [Candidatus Limnocylindrales bacterium]|nr:preprotein translocase subunit SecA [Candidatus Limnocylindrales bacterium]
MLGFLSRFVDSNDRELKRIQPYVDDINDLTDEVAAMSDEEIRERFAELRAEVHEKAVPEEPSEDELHHPDLERRRDLAKDRRKREIATLQDALDEVLPDVFALAREAMGRTLGMRHFDEQLMGGVVLHQGKIAEMRTGEGKTFVPTLAAALDALAGRGVHVVTVNDYLARRDPQWMGAVYHFLGLSVGMILGQQSDGGAQSYVYEPGYPTNDERLVNLRPCTRREAYAADITYGTNNEFGFDYLRDNMVTDLNERVQRERYFGIVDEVDNILIDEARTPLIISGQAEESGDLYYTFARLVPRLKERPEGAEEGGDYFIDLKDRAVSPTEEGIEKIESWLKVDNLYAADPRLARHFEQALRAHALYKRDRDYIVKDGEIVIVDEFTGRQMPGRRWSEGLHQAIEAQEGLRVQRESVTLATITFQNYFRLYDKLAGMTGTAMTEAEEFHKIYDLEVVAIPTHKPMVREDQTDLVYRSEDAKFNAVIDEIEELTAEGRPVLVGTTSVEKSERLSRLLDRRGIKHETLNAKFHEKESGIVAQAGRSGAVTIATNMAGRGTDILLGGNPAGLASELLKKRGLNPAEVDKAIYDAAFAEARSETDAEHERVVAAGGLHIIGTERHESRRIDNQLRGRAGRQGDPGSSRFYLSLDDELMRRFASDRIASLMERLGLDEDNYIESGIVGKTIESAQSRVEGFNFDIRKRVVEFDDVINRQRETIYAERDKVLRNEDLTDTIRAFLDEEIDAVVDRHVGAGVETLPEPAEAMAALLQDLNRMGLGPDRVSGDELLDLHAPAAIADHVKDVADEALAAREAEIGPEAWAQVERFVLLRTIDSLWVEHLTELDDMRRGIGLRGYSQSDPLNEFKKEAFGLFEELKDFIRQNVANTILRVQVTQQQAPPPGPFVMSGPGQAAPSGNGRNGSNGNGSGAAARTPVAAGSAGAGGRSVAASFGGAVTGTAGTRAIAGAGASGTGGSGEARGGASGAGPARGGSPGATGAGAQARPGYTPSGDKIGRNDACWCGSGLKYKKCHGK